MDLIMKVSGNALLLANLLLIGYYMGVDASPTVKTGLGEIIGNLRTLTVRGKDYTTHRFLGIPYAKAPTGDLRFQKPQPADKFEQPYTADNFGANCMQIQIFPTPKLMSEDCLFLNVFVPIQKPDKESGHPVMVWVHGGGFAVGSGNEYISDTLASHGNVIVVTVNYRLGLWGFLSTEDEHASGNYGMWDQRMAFQWVNENIGAFGGDNARVTIFGESAGGVSVSMQSLYSPNKGLFQRVIAQSGTAMISSAFNPQPSTLAKWIAEQAQCSSTETTKEIVSCLRSKDADSLLTLLKELSTVPENAMKLIFIPTKDDNFIKIPHKELMAKQNDFKEEVDFLRSLDLINGANKHDGAFALLVWAGTADAENFKPTREDMNTQHVPMGVYMQCGLNVPDSVKEMIISEYTNWQNPDDPELLKYQFIKLFGDFMFNVPMVDYSKLHSNGSANVKSYTYEFRPRPTTSLLPTPSWVDGANHGDDLGFTFGFDEVTYFMSRENMTQPAEWEYDLSYEMMTYWTNFAKTGNPNDPETVNATWPSYSTEWQHYMAFDKDMASKGAARKFLFAKEYNFWIKTVQPVMEAIAHAHDDTSPFKQTSSDSCEVKGDCGGE